MSNIVNRCYIEVHQVFNQTFCYPVVACKSVFIFILTTGVITTTSKNSENAVKAGASFNYNNLQTCTNKCQVQKCCLGYKAISRVL